MNELYYITSLIMFPLTCIYFDKQMEGQDRVMAMIISFVLCLMWPILPILWLTHEAMKRWGYRG